MGWGAAGGLRLAGGCVERDSAYDHDSGVVDLDESMGDSR